MMMTTAHAASGVILTGIFSSIPYVNNLASSVSLWLWQGTVVPVEDSIFRQANQLTLTGALIVAVAVLWRTLAKKDDAMAKKDETNMSMVKTVTEALITVAESNRELRRVVEETLEAKRDLKEAMDRLSDGLGVLPCTVIRENPQHIGVSEKRLGR